MNNRGSDRVKLTRVKLTKCEKFEWVERYHYASDIVFE